MSGRENEVVTLPNPLAYADGNGEAGCPIRARIAHLDEGEWSAILGRFGDGSIYQARPYGSVHWGARQLRHLVLEQDSIVVAASQIRVVQIPFIRKGVAYVRWGPLTRPQGLAFDSALARSAYAALVREFVERRRMLLRVLPPVWNADPAAVATREVLTSLGFAPNGRITPSRTLRMDLSPPLETLRKNLLQKWRNCLNGAERNGLTVEQGTSLELYDRFLLAYRSLRQRKQFDTTVDEQLFRQMQADLPENLKMRTFLCHKEGQLLNAMVVSALGDTGIYLLGATSDSGLNLKGSYLLQWEVLRWLKHAGFRYYDLGGINPERNPGVYHFKQGLGGQDTTHVGAWEKSKGWVSRAVVRLAEALRRSKRN